MGFIIQYVANYAPWIYAICGLVALYHIYKIWIVRSERRQAVFSLEREKAVHDTYNIFAVALILLVIMGATYFVSNTLSQAVDPLVDQALSPTPELPFVPTPTNTPLSVTATPTWTATAAPSVEATSEEVVPEETVGPSGLPAESLPPTATPAPSPVAVQAPACPDNRAMIIRPGNNETVQGSLNVIGTARHENFQYYKVEYAVGANASGGFGYLAGGESPVENGVLITFDTRTLGNGAYTLRLVVVDQTGNFPPPCSVTISVQN